MYSLIFGSVARGRKCSIAIFTVAANSGPGFTWMTSEVFQTGGPSRRKSSEVLDFSSADSHWLSRMVGQMSQRMPRGSMTMQQLVSGRSGVSAMMKASLHAAAPRRRRAPTIFTSSACRSPEPRNQQARRSPWAVSTTHEPWLWSESGGWRNSLRKNGGSLPVTLLRQQATESSKDKTWGSPARRESGTGGSLGFGRSASKGWRW